MRLFYTAFILFLSAPLLFSQEIDFAPFQGNPVLRSHASHLNLEKQAFLKRHFDLDINDQGGDRDGLNGCPPDLPFDKIIVESGGFIEMELDTFGLAVDSTPPTIELLYAPPLQFGVAKYLESTNMFVYVATAGLTGIASDTMLFHYQQGGVVDTFLKVAVDIRRSGKTIIADEASVVADGVLDYCLDDEFDFPLPRKCFQFANCVTNYEGDGYQFKYFRNDSCFVYLASRFPGTDTVCVEICDGIGICDIFKIPIHIIGDTLSISSAPFFEDFSTSNGPYPSRERWLEDDVFVNNTFSKNPPSIGMATFDGLDAGGKPYELPAGGIGDQLTSKPINLSSLNANSNVYLRFFVSPKGYGQEPEEDDFFVHFKNKQGDWVQVLKLDGTGNIPLDSIPPFEFYAIKIEDPNFFHNAFQMRFRAQSSPGGYGDWWHLDYIHLDKGSTDQNRFSDVAFVTGASDILLNYTSMPLSHFKKAELDSVFLSTLTNNDNIVQNIDNSSINVSELTLSQVFSTEIGLDANVINLDPDTIVEFGNSYKGSILTDFNTYIESIPFTAPRIFQTKYTLSVGVEAAEFRSNDTVTHNTIFSDYFAHDDGTAELQIFFGNPVGGEEMAIRYKANVADSLKGIRFMFPHFTFFDIESQVFNLKVWFGNENGPVGDAVFEQELMRPYFADAQFDTLQGFTTYVLEDIFGNPTPLFIPEGTIFYVGFEQLTATSLGIPVGYDLNNVCGCNFRKLKNDWTPLSSNIPKGAMMIRPVFGGVINTSNGVNDMVNPHSIFSVFPNPASGQLNITMGKGELNDFKYMIFNQLGQMMQHGDMAPAIHLDGLKNGSYFLQAIKKDSGEVWLEKFVIAN